MKLILKQLGLLLIIAVIGTIIDYIVHSSSIRFYVDPVYYRNKIIFATVVGMLALWVLRNWIKNPTKLALAVYGVIALLLQVKYFILGYDRFFVFLFLFLHYFMLIIPAIPIFRKHPNLFVKDH